MGVKRKEYRAVFTGPDGRGGSYGPEQSSLGIALKDTPERSAETLEYLSGVEEREVEPWRPVPLSDIQAVK